MKIANYILALITLIFLSSCGASIYEDINIDENGKGTYSIQSDMIPMMRNMAYMMSKMKDNDSSAPKVIDSAKVEAQIFKKMPEFVDSTLDIMSKLDEEQKKDAAFMNAIGKTRVYMKGGSRSKKMELGMTMNFDNIEEVNLIGKYSKNYKKAQLGKQLKLNSGATLFSYQNNQLSKVVSQNPSNENDEKRDEKSLDAFYKEFKYQTIIHSKRKIKRTKGENIKMQNDSLVIFEYNLLDYMNGNANQNFTISF